MTCPAEVEAPASTAPSWTPDHHVTCRRCYPDCYPGIKAICGVDLLGIDPLPGSTLCGDCKEQAPEHWLTCDGMRKD